MAIKDVFGAGETNKELIKQTGKLIKEPFHNVVNPSTKTFGDRLANIIDLIFTPVEVGKIYKDHKIDLFKNKLFEEINAIPEAKRTTPPLNIIGPAVEGAKFYIDDEELRNMFAKLIASAMSSDTNKLVHPSFVEVIKQLSPLDAVNISSFKKCKMHPMVDYVRIYDRNVQFPLLRNIVLGLSACKDVHEISSSITNLIRLGLLEKDLNMCIATGNEYLADGILAQVEMQMDHTDAGKRSLIKTVDSFIHLTTYGKSFVATCV